MHYLDTSVLTSYYCAEDRSPRIQKLLSGIDDSAISPLVEVEFYCALGRKARARTVKTEDARRVIAQFRQHLSTPVFHMAQIRTADYKIAGEWIAELDSPLRALDALHLAIAFNGGMIIVTADKVLAQSARSLGVKYEFAG
ncbi:MAG TPA: type II toxin-antitoxin system VapC family toxin [Candidatus Brocadiia bacterium]|nr:type II toxin-antitoxin system VapC family toxin [Candidatus Brocadiia bacterium]